MENIFSPSAPEKKRELGSELPQKKDLSPKSQNQMQNGVMLDLVLFQRTVNDRLGCGVYLLTCSRL